MYTLLLLVVVFALLLEPAAAASPIMDYTLPGAPMDPFRADLQGLNLDPFCQCCVIPFFQCMHAIHQAPYVAPDMLYNDPVPLTMALPDLHQTEPDLAPIAAYNNEADRQPLIDEHIYYINANETTVQPATVQAHVEDIYTPGDRLEQRKPSGSRKATHKRQAPRRGGYPCNIDGCERTFDRACELNRHQKTHLDRSERPHKCSVCHEGFLYPKDLNRHQRKHIAQSSAQVTFFCRYPGCGNSEGFSRRDNLLRHQRKQHASMVPAAA